MNERQQIEKPIADTGRQLGIDEFEIEEESYYIEVPEYREVNGYIKGEVLGKGNFGTVEEYVSRRTFKRYAIKIINKQTNGRPRLRAADEPNDGLLGLEKELKLCSKLNHKNVMKILETFEENNAIYLVLEFCPRVLEDFLKDKDGNLLKILPKSQSHWYFCELIEGIEYLHNNGIIHRDIKPTNILIDNSNTIKIADFGIACELSPFLSNDTISGSDGTFLYKPPELLLVEIFEYSGSKFDIWSSGVILFQMISGDYPFPPESLGVFIDNVCNKDVKYPKEVLEDIQLMNLLNRIFDKDFNSRITINEMKRHPWVVMKWSTKDFIKFPDNSTKQDVLGSMSTLPYIEYHLHPFDPKQKVTKEEYLESKNRKASVRGNRLNRRRTAPKIRKRGVKKLVRLGLKGK